MPAKIKPKYDSSEEFKQKAQGCSNVSELLTLVSTFNERELDHDLVLDMGSSFRTPFTVDVVPNGAGMVLSVFHSERRVIALQSDLQDGLSLSAYADGVNPLVRLIRKEVGTPLVMSNGSLIDRVSSALRYAQVMSIKINDGEMVFEVRPLKPLRPNEYVYLLSEGHERFTVTLGCESDTNEPTISVKGLVVVTPIYFN